MSDVATLIHRIEAMEEAIERFLADVDDEDRAEAGLNPLMEAHIADFRAALSLSAREVSEERAREAMVRISRNEYPEIVQAARWSDEDSGTDHFEPGIGFIVDDADGLSVPLRWVPYLATIEAALAALDHAQPHPLDEDAIRVLREQNRDPTIHDSAAYCFVCGEHTPMTAMQRSSEELWIASRFLNEYFEGWNFDPASGFGDFRSALATEVNADPRIEGMEADRPLCDNNEAAKDGPQ